MERYVILLVHSTSHAIHAERVLQAAGISVKLVPTPRELSSDCGSAVRMAAADWPGAQAALRAASAPFDRAEPWP